MSERALGGDERGVVGSAGPDQTLGRELGCAAVQRLLNPFLALWCCVAALQSLF